MLCFVVPSGIKWAILFYMGVLHGLPMIFIVITMQVHGNQVHICDNEIIQKCTKPYCLLYKFIACLYRGICKTLCYNVNTTR